jgi:hypothetical protein
MLEAETALADIDLKRSQTKVEQYAMDRQEIVPMADGLQVGEIVVYQLDGISKRRESSSSQINSSGIGIDAE